MAQLSYPPSHNPVSVIGSQFIAPCPFEVKIVKSSSGDHLITDIDDKIIFKVIRRRSPYHEQRLILDADGIPIVLIRKKILSAHSEWKAFKGNSHADSEIIFSTKTPKVVQSKTNVHVFLANKTSSKDLSDFKITGSWSNRSCTICMGDSSTIIAQMHKMEPPEDDKNKFMVKIYPYVDYAFVVTLMAIVEAMKSSDDSDNDDADQVIGDVGLSIVVVAQAIGSIIT